MIITRYLTREVISATLSVTVVLLLAFLSQQIVRYLNYVAVGKIPTSILVQLIAFEVPYLLAILLPLGLFLGILLGYSRLYADSEMAILNLCGFTMRRIYRITSLIAMGVVLVVLGLMIWVNPLISAERQHLMESDEATVHLVQTLIPGRFQASPDGSHVMYVEKLSRDHKRAENVFLAQQAPAKAGIAEQPLTLVLARQGYQQKETKSQDQFFVTLNGYRYEGTPGQNAYKITQFQTYGVRIPKSDIGTNHEADEAIPVWKLLVNYNNPKYAAEFQWRISIGLSAFILALLAIPFSEIKPRQSKYLSILPAMLLYIIYINLLFIARRWVEIGSVPVWAGMWWVHLAMLMLLPLLLFLRARRWK